MTITNTIHLQNIQEETVEIDKNEIRPPPKRPTTEKSILFEYDSADDDVYDDKENCKIINVAMEPQWTTFATAFEEYAKNEISKEIFWTIHSFHRSVLMHNTLSITLYHLVTILGMDVKYENHKIEHFGVCNVMMNNRPRFEKIVLATHIGETSQPQIEENHRHHHRILFFSLGTGSNYYVDFTASQFGMYDWGYHSSVPLSVYPEMDISPYYTKESFSAAEVFESTINDLRGTPESDMVKISSRVLTKYLRLQYAIKRKKRFMSRR